jgi:hypothetical protein
VLQLLLLRLVLRKNVRTIVGSIRVMGAIALRAISASASTSPSSTSSATASSPTKTASTTSSAWASATASFVIVAHELGRPSGKAHLWLMGHIGNRKIPRLLHIECRELRGRSLLWLLLLLSKMLILVGAGIFCTTRVIRLGSFGSSGRVKMLRRRRLLLQVRRMILWWMGRQWLLMRKLVVLLRVLVLWKVRMHSHTIAWKLIQHWIYDTCGQQKDNRELSRLPSTKARRYSPCCIGMGGIMNCIPVVGSMAKPCGGYN